MKLKIFFWFYFLTDIHLLNGIKLKHAAIEKDICSHRALNLIKHRKTWE